MNLLCARILLMQFALLVLAGCVAPPLQPRADAMAPIKRIAIVAMETRPLSVDADYVTTGPLSILEFMPRYTVGMTRALGVLTGIFILLDLPEMTERRPMYPPAVQRQISPTETWHPSVELAQVARRLLDASGRESMLSPGIQLIPGIQDRGRTVLMENWMAPIRAWYNDASPSPRKVEPALKDAQAVMEFGISNYEIFSGKLLLQVHVKLFDPASGKLLGRARASSFTPLLSMDEAFADDAKLFKDATLRAGARLLGNCLSELGIF